VILFPVQVIFRLRTPSLERKVRDRSNTVTDIDKITLFQLAVPVKPLPNSDQIPKVTKGSADARDGPSRRCSSFDDRRMLNVEG